ncbi:MAG: ribosomal protein S18-alanine N-acetyltransferase [Peptostreptococcaceae bacterium]|nr:ribosomal protein S18-alanine N-acetyltransferase [Peptostreptococcaceae bacterium]
MNIRLAVSEDIDDIVNVENKCFTTPWSKNSIKREIEINELATLIVADVDGMVVGYLGIWFVLDEGDITNVSVLPEYRRRSIATKLLEQVIEIAKTKGTNALSLEVRESNVAGIKLYEKFGFKNLGIRKNYYEDNGENAIIMWKVDIC